MAARILAPPSHPYLAPNVAVPQHYHILPANQRRVAISIHKLDGEPVLLKRGLVVGHLDDNQGDESADIAMVAAYDTTSLVGPVISLLGRRMQRGGEDSS